jgi:hypothetical protein
MWPERSRTARRELRRSHCRRSRQTEQELANLITFVAKGDLASPRLHEEIQAREHRFVELERQLERLHTARPSVPAPIDSGWVHQKLDALKQLLARDPAGARREVKKHVEDLRIAPAPEAGDRAPRITGRPRIDGLLGAAEAVRLQLVAGARNTEIEQPDLRD